MAVNSRRLPLLQSRRPKIHFYGAQWAVLKRSHRRNHYRYQVSNMPHREVEIMLAVCVLQEMHNTKDVLMDECWTTATCLPSNGPILLLLQAPPHQGLPPPPPPYLTTQNFTPLNCCSRSTYMYVGQKRFLPVALDNRRSYALVAWQPQCPPPKGLVLSTSGCQQNDLDINCPSFSDFCSLGDHAAWNKR